MYRLLIVDDERDICENLKYLLNWADYGFTSIMTATSYQEAANLAVDFQPHAALVDVKLGSYWGYDLVGHLKSLGLKTVFCMLSGFDDIQYLRRSMQAGASDYLLKPVNVVELRRFLERTVVTDLKGKITQEDDRKLELDPVLKVPYTSLSNITNKIILAAKTDYRSSLTLTAIAESFQMSSKYIGRIFLKDTGMKFTDYLMAYRMLEAKRLLLNTQEKISVIANMVGYMQLNHFYIHFKNYFGISPGALRNGEPEEDASREEQP